MSEESLARLSDIISRSIRPHILLVEDDPNDRELLIRELGGMGTTDQAKTIREAVEKIRTGRFDRCFLDLKLPDSMDAMSTVVTIQSEKPSMPITVVTGSINEELVNVLKRRGLSILLKPVSHEQLRTLLNHE